jgi:predicted PurR-regulated permease PerM
MLFYGIVAILAYLVFLIFQPFLPALAWAVIIVVMSYPSYERVRRRFNPTVAAIICTMSVTLLLIIPTILVAGAFVHQGVQAVQTVQAKIASGHFEWVNRLWMQLESKFPDANQANLATILSRYTDQGATFVAAKLGTVVRNTASFLFHLSVTILAMFYLYRDGEVFMARVRALLPFENQRRDKMLKESRDLIFASVMSSAIP